MERGAITAMQIYITSTLASLRRVVKGAEVPRISFAATLIQIAHRSVFSRKCRSYFHVSEVGGWIGYIIYTLIYLTCVEIGVRGKNLETRFVSWGWLSLQLSFRFTGCTHDRSFVKFVRYVERT